MNGVQRKLNKETNTKKLFISTRVSNEKKRRMLNPVFNRHIKAFVICIYPDMMMRGGGRGFKYLYSMLGI